MAADAGLLAEIEAELARARDVAETRSIADLRQHTGAGHDDLMEAVDELREAGKISEVTPGEYLPFDSNAAAREQRAEARQRPADDDVEEPGVSLAEAERGAGSRRGAGSTEIVRVQLDAAVAGVMDADGLGKLVEAGIQKAAERNVGFVFEVTA